ncbi:hypothetical protein VV11_023690, partial [Trichodesmium erythraeum 21-75]|nr:hypothetical protein [Trichodesmium erythraeum 21-75]
MHSDSCQRVSTFSLQNFTTLHLVTRTFDLRQGLDCKILATVHDEIILEAHESIADEVAKI